MFNILLLSGIIPSTLLLFLGIFWFFQSLSDLTLNLRVSFIYICFVLTILGYIGLWKALIYPINMNPKLTIIFTFLGVIGYISFFLFEGGKTAINWLIDFKEPFEILLFFWSIIISLICLTYLFIETKTVKK